MEEKKGREGSGMEGKGRKWDERGDSPYKSYLASGATAIATEIGDLEIFNDPERRLRLALTADKRYFCGSPTCCPCNKMHLHFGLKV